MVLKASSDPSKLLAQLADIKQSTVYTITNHAADTALDCNSTSDGELADLIGSLCIDLIAAGIIKGTVTGA